MDRYNSIAMRAKYINWRMVRLARLVTKAYNRLARRWGYEELWLSPWIGTTQTTWHPKSVRGMKISDIYKWRFRNNLMYHVYYMMRFFADRIY